MAEQRPEPPAEPDLGPGAPVTSAGHSTIRGRRALWVVLAIVLVAQAVGLFSPGNPSVPEPPFLDKVVHAAMFGLPVYLLVRLTGRKWLWAGVFTVYAGLSEVIQYYLIPGRDGDILDFTADVVGIAIALLVHRWQRTA